MHTFPNHTNSLICVISTHKRLAHFNHATLYTTTLPVHPFLTLYFTDCTDFMTRPFLLSNLFFLVLVSLLPAALRAAQICQYLVYSEADSEVFRPAGATRCTDGGEIWHGVPLLHAKFHPHRCNDKGVGHQKLKFLLRVDRNL